MHMLNLVVIAVNVLALGAYAVLTFGPHPELMKWTVRFVVIPALVGVARRSAWGRGLSALALGAQVVRFTIQLRRE
jgi:hypothetical protein